MTAFVIPFLRKKAAPADWTQAELAEFYRVEATLIAAGMQVKTERGLTDENDPWFVFFHVNDEQDVIIHFARVRGSYLVSASGLDAIQSGGDFHTLVRQLLAQYDDLAARRREGALNDVGSDKNCKVVPHPASMLWILVALAFVKSAESRSFDSHHAAAEGDPALSPRTSGSDPLFALISFALQSVVVTWAIDAMASVAYTGPEDKFLSWLAADPHTAPERTMALTTAESTSANVFDDGHGTHATDLASHQGSGGMPTPAIAPVPVSEHLILDHANDQSEIFATASTHNSIEIAPVVVTQTAPVAQPTTEAQTVLAAAEVNIIQKAVETVPDVIAHVLDHAIHPSGSVQGTVSDTISLLASQPIGTAHASATSDMVAVPPLISGAAGPAVLSNQPANITPTAGVATANAAFVPATGSSAAPPIVSDKAELVIATSAVHEFLAVVPQAQALAIQNTLIVYDPLAVNIDSAHVQALTFDFADGSHISLIGLPSELTHVLTGHL